MSKEQAIKLRGNGNDDKTLLIATTFDKITFCIVQTNKMGLSRSIGIKIEKTAIYSVLSELLRNPDD